MVRIWTHHSHHFFYLPVTIYHISILLKKTCNSNIFLNLVIIKKLNLKSKTKYTSPLKIAQQQKLSIVKVKTIKLN